MLWPAHTFYTLAITSVCCYPWQTHEGIITNALSHLVTQINEQPFKCPLNFSDKYTIISWRISTHVKPLSSSSYTCNTWEHRALIARVIQHRWAERRCVLGARGKRAERRACTLCGGRDTTVEQFRRRTRGRQAPPAAVALTAVSADGSCTVACLRRTPTAAAIYCVALFLEPSLSWAVCAAKNEEAHM